MASSKTAQGTRGKASGAAKRTLKGSKASSTAKTTKKTAKSAGKTVSAANKAPKRTRRAPSQSEGTVGRPGPTPVEPPKPRPKRVGHLPIPQSTFFF